MREVVGVSSRRLDGPRRCTTQPPQIGNAPEPFRPGYLEPPAETLERLLSTDNIDDHYEVEELPFARGKYATVRRCRHRKTGQQYAAKYLKKRRRSTDLRYEILHEVAVLHACAECPRIVNLFQIFETAHEMVLVLELAPGGELQMLLDNDQIPSERTVKRFMRQILNGLEFLHSINVAHLDIKPQNLVLTGEFPACDVKLCDFGISRYIGENADIREILGTPDYVAPEVLNYEAISLSTDMWSVGVLLYVLLTGCSPFGGDSKQETFCNISQCRLDFPDDLFETISEDAQDLMKRLMVKECGLRLTATECLQHPWFQTADLPKSIPVTKTMTESDAVDATRKMADAAVKRQPSVRKAQEMTRKTIECVREAPQKTFATTPEESRRSIAEKPRKHSFNDSFDDAGSVREKSRKLSERRPSLKGDEEPKTVGDRSRTLRENLSNLAKKFEEKPEVAKKAFPSETLPIHLMFNRQSDKIFKCKRIFIDDELGNTASATLLIPVNSGQSSMSSISGGSSETSSITSEMSVDSGGDCSSLVSSDDSLDCVYKSAWDKSGKVWARECRGSFERALSRFNLDDGPRQPEVTPQRRYQKSGFAKRSLCTSSPILNKIGNLTAVADSRKYGVQLTHEGNGNVVIIREVRGGRYSKFSEVKCESVQSRIRKLQEGKS